uniref:LOB domain-containing protein n=1 Tax=Brassica oleracea var. oleracea TaxID=109376 RepID=A0A0D3E3H3_BRAOL
MMKLASHEQNHLLASSILKEGAAWTDDNIRGLRIPKKLPHSTQVSLTADDSSPPCNPQNNLQNLAGQLSDVLENLSPISQHDELEAKFREERAVLEAKYEKLYQPIYAKLTQEDTKMDEGEDKTAQERGVLSFWLTALQNNDVTSHEVTMHDEEALRTEIDWYPAKCLTQKIHKKKPKKGSTNPAPFTKVEDCESFFSFFNPPEVPDEDEDIDEDRELQNLMEQDYEIGFTIRDKIIPHAVHGLLLQARLQSVKFKWNDIPTIETASVMESSLPRIALTMVSGKKKILFLKKDRDNPVQMEANFSGTSSTPRQNQKIDVGGRQSDYEAATKLFGTTNIISMMKLASHEQNHLLASSILKEGAAWTDDNIRGGYGVIQKLMWEIKLHEAYLSERKKKISEEKKQIVLLLNQYI